MNVEERNEDEDRPREEENKEGKFEKSEEKVNEGGDWI